MSRIDDTRGDINPYKEIIVNKAKKIEPILTQIEQWSILSITLNYIQYNRHPKNFHSLNISVVNVSVHRRRRGMRLVAVFMVKYQTYSGKDI